MAGSNHSLQTHRPFVTPLRTVVAVALGALACSLFLVFGDAGAASAASAASTDEPLSSCDAAARGCAVRMASLDALWSGFEVNHRRLH